MPFENGEFARARDLFKTRRMHVREELRAHAVPRLNFGWTGSQRDSKQQGLTVDPGLRGFDGVVKASRCHGSVATM